MKSKEKNELKEIDISIAFASGILTAILNEVFVSDLDLAKSHMWGSAKINKFVIKAAQLIGYKGAELSGAIRKIEESARLLSDKATNDFGGGKYHHLNDFCHHPTVVGLAFSVLSQFTGNGYGTDKEGHFTSVKIEGWKKTDLCSSIYNGTVVWFFHMISDMSGSSGSVKKGSEGMGIPGPFVSMLKEISTLPGIRSLCKNKSGTDAIFEVFSGEKNKMNDKDSVSIDLRTEIGLANEMVNGNQGLPIIINEMLVCACFSVTRFCNEVKTKDVHNIEGLKTLDLSACMSFDSKELMYMRMIASGTFTTVNIIVSGIKAFVKNTGDKAGFFRDFICGINIVGLSEVVIVGTETISEEIYNIFLELVNKTGFSNVDISSFYEVMRTGYTVLGKMKCLSSQSMGLGYVSLSIWVLSRINRALAELKVTHAQRVLIEKECGEKILILQENNERIENEMRMHFLEVLSVSGKELDVMDKTLTEASGDVFIQSNAILQKQFGKIPQFETNDEFEDLLNSKTTFKL